MSICYNLDVHMTSPPTSPSHGLQGASCTTDGVLHGWAQGNVFNYADADDVFDMGPQRGKIHVYTLQWDPTVHKPDMTLTTEVAPTLKPVLKALARSFSPVRSKYYYELRVETFTSCLRFQLAGLCL